MMNSENEARSKSIRFAARILKLYDRLCQEDVSSFLAEQLLESGTAIGQYLVRGSDVLFKEEGLSYMTDALQKCSLTQYWLKLLPETSILPKQELDSIEDECISLKNLISEVMQTNYGPDFFEVEDAAAED